MKLSLYVIIAMLVPMLLFMGCAHQSKNLAGTDWYSEVPKAKHERRFPHGHKNVPESEGENCVYNEKTESYFCQFDWFE